MDQQEHLYDAQNITGLKVSEVREHLPGGTIISCGELRHAAMTQRPYVELSVRLTGRFVAGTGWVACERPADAVGIYCQCCKQLYLFGVKDPLESYWLPVYCDPDRITSARRRDYHCNGCACEHRRELDRQNSANYRATRSDRAEVVVCEHCGDQFKPKRSTARFCSTACRVKAHRQAAGVGLTAVVRNQG